MGSFESIDSFLTYKQQVEKERPLLTACPQLITVDGVDGSGKSSLSRLVYECLRNEFGEDGVALLDITNLKGSPLQERLQAIKGMVSDSRENLLYAAGVNRAYQELVLPALQAGKVVVVDRSEVDLMRYALATHDQKVINERKQYIEDGTLTHRTWAGNRVFVEVPAEDVLESLTHRSTRSKYDPTSLEEVQESITAQQEAERIIQEMKHEGEVEVIRVINTRMKAEEDLPARLREVANDITRQLHLSGKRQ